jgi:hypothetical protein
VESLELERRVEMLRMMVAVRRLRRPIRVLVLARAHVEGKCLPVVVTFVVEAQETAEKAWALAKTKMAMASA